MRTRTRRQGPGLQSQAPGMVFFPFISYFILTVIIFKHRLQMASPPLQLQPQPRGQGPRRASRAPGSFLPQPQPQEVSGPWFSFFTTIPPNTSLLQGCKDATGTGTQDREGTGTGHARGTRRVRVSSLVCFFFLSNLIY